VKGYPHDKFPFNRVSGENEQDYDMDVFILVDKLDQEMKNKVSDTV
jgi:hypothetical protein